ncbi:MAG: isoaspartyl peptidase/L-asparaginase, partial [Elusimicrobia bacterium]|nr:isoaspartyl peptidase/L-asparaginase [Elusimicrobiota bacterium]
KAGQAVLARGGDGLSAVESAIRVLEDDPEFNAGRGAVFTAEGKNELDASIMEGAELRAGAVAGVTTVKNPITLARAVMEKSKHVLLVGAGAERFGKEVGVEIVDPSYFKTERRWKEIEEIWRQEKEPLKKGSLDRRTHHQWGTVGAVAVDASGHLFAGTSTGGMTNKRPGRVGDSPIIGAGTYADDASCAVSSTGHGEYFIRYAVAHDIAARVKYKKLSVARAAEEVIQGPMRKAGGEGGVIVLSPKGDLAFSYNSEGLYRGYALKDGTVRVFLYED